MSEATVITRQRAIADKMRQAVRELNDVLIQACEAGMTGAIGIAGFTSEPRLRELHGSGLKPSETLVTVNLTRELRVSVQDLEYREVTKL